jgi:hypothetical protein
VDEGRLERRKKYIMMRSIVEGTTDEIEDDIFVELFSLRLLS